MEASIFLPSSLIENSQADEFNQLPDASQRRGNPFWAFMRSTLGLPEERFPYDAQGVSPAIATIRAWEAAQRPPVVTVVDLVQEAATHVADAVKEGVKKIKPRDKAKAWLGVTLRGEILAETVKQMAKEAGISGRTLRRAFEQGNFMHRKNADGVSVWSQPQADKQDGQK
jgi:hypothetical protein